MNPIILGLAFIAAPKALRVLGVITAEDVGKPGAPSAKTPASDYWMGQDLTWHQGNVDALLRQAAAAIKAGKGPVAADALSRAQEHLRAMATIVKYGLTPSAAQAMTEPLRARAVVWTQLQVAGKKRFAVPTSSKPAAQAAPRAQRAQRASPDLSVLRGGVEDEGMTSPEEEGAGQMIGPDDDMGLSGIT